VSLDYLIAFHRAHSEDRDETEELGGGFHKQAVIALETIQRRLAEAAIESLSFLLASSGKEVS